MSIAASVSADGTTGGRSPGPQVLYATERTRVTRVWRPDGGSSVLQKEVLGRGAVERLRLERRVLQRLTGVPGVLQLAPGCGDAELLLQDEQGETLSAVIGGGRFDAATLVALAVELARGVGAMHRAGVLHKDINPANVIVAGAARRPVLIDFDLATTFAGERPTFTHHREFVGTLPYLPPEQTGRTGMPVDERADLYSLGATLYEVATGVPPFPVGDPLQMAHDVLAGVPTAPAETAAGIPAAFSAIVMRLLEKEPDRRYQSADGLFHDLSRLADALAHGRDDVFELGERDFPVRLSAPTRLIGREAEVRTLRAALDGARSGGSRGVLVAGAPGVGKTVLVNALRSAVAERGGWFVTGKFDKLRQDTQSSAVPQALRAVGRLLLAGTDAEVAAARAQLTAELGDNVALAASMPEFSALLGVAAPKPREGGGDPRQVGVRLKRSAVEILRAVVSPQRPLVMVLDDLQWSGASSMDLIDMVLSDDRLTGLLIVGMYREAEVDASHPLAVALARWDRLGTAPAVVRLANLPPSDLGELLGDMLRLPPEPAGRLAAVVGARTAGNPFDTVELVNALRRDGALVAGPAGWTWEAATIRRFVGQGDVVDLLATRIDELPPGSREVLDVLSCLGGELDLDLVRAATALDAAELGERLLAPLEDGLLVLQQADVTLVRFRHDRVQQAAYGRLDDARRAALHLTLARRLAGVPGLTALAAEQYLPCVGAIDDPAERRTAAGLLIAAAAAMDVINPVSADRFLVAATDLLAAGDPLGGVALRQRHAVLYSLGRLAEADTVYADIARAGDDPFDLIEPTCIQVASLGNRGRAAESVELGLTSLRRIGVEVPDGDFAAVVAARWDELAAWAANLSLDADLAAPVPDSRTDRTARMLTSIGPATFTYDHAIGDWMLFAVKRLWEKDGPSWPLLGVLAGSIATTSARDDYRIGYLLGRHALAVAEGRGYHREGALARHVFAGVALHWFEPLEDSIPRSRLAREAMVRDGTLQMACFTFNTSLAALTDCAPTVDSVAEDVAAALVFAARTGNDYAVGTFAAFRQLVRALRAETAGPGSFGDHEFDEQRHLAGPGRQPRTAMHYHVCRSLAATLFGDVDAQHEHAAAAMALLLAATGSYPIALAHLLHGLALANRARTADTGQQREALLAGLDAELRWLTARAADAPGNFGHLATLLGAERAWAAGDCWQAVRAFDRARREVAGRSRPWHQALITERAALCLLDAGMEQAGRDLLAAAKQMYQAWCATGKVRQLDAEYPFLRGAAGHQPVAGASRSSGPVSSSITAADIDMLAILRTSQALSSETNSDRLRVRIGELLGALTGATAVLIALRPDGTGDWMLWDATGDAADAVPVEQAARDGRFPLTVFRYAERTAAPLLVEDATRDDRFARDPYLAGLPRCSMLVVPVSSNGTLRAVLMLENRLGRGAFAADRLDAVMLVTGQLAVSLDNAQLYASLEQKVAERTAALEQANQALAELSTTDALTGLPNRRHFDTTLETEWRRSARQGRGFGLAMIDVDRFKAYNDRYGHLAGDACLRTVGAALRERLRTDLDVVCRYGGEEFAIIMPGVDEKAALAIAERVRAAVAGRAETHDGAPAGIVTVSIGVAVYRPGTSLKAEELVAAADLGLYRAKGEGRNRVAVAPQLDGTAR